MQLPSGRGKVNAWGENHLWLRYCKGSKLSGLVEPRISAAKASESVNFVYYYPLIPNAFNSRNLIADIWAGNVTTEILL